MSILSNAKHGFSACIVASLALLLASCSQEAVPTYGIGTGGQQGRYLLVGAALTRLVNRNEENFAFRLEYEMSSGSVANINAIASGDLQFGIAQSDHQFQAVNGRGEWEGTGPQQDLRSVFSMHTEAVTLVAGGDSGIRSIDDLKGKIVDIGASGSGTRRNAIDALGAAGIDWKRDIQFREESTDEKLVKFMRGEFDAFFFTAGHPNSEIKYATFSVRGARMIPLANIDGLVSTHPYMLRARIPAGLYPLADNELDIETVGVNATLLASANVPDDVIYAITKATFENLETLAMQGSGYEFSALLEDEFLDGLTAPIHPGALKYYREIGLTVPDR